MTLQSNLQGSKKHFAAKIDPIFFAFNILRKICYHKECRLTCQIEIDCLECWETISDLQQLLENSGILQENIFYNLVVWHHGKDKLEVKIA